MSVIQYNRVIRKIIVAFGNLFDSIPLVKYNSDNTEAERVMVPIAYAAKELYVKRLEEDLTLDKKVQTTLPRLSFEMTGLSYNNDRKQNTNIRNFAQTTDGVISQYNPVPYDFDFNLYLYTRNIEDAHQILEHILPYFTPDYTLKLNLIPEMGIVKEIPIILNDISSDITYEGNRDSETRIVIWTLNFKVKGFIFGKSSSAKVIKTSITNILNDITPEDIVAFNMTVPGIGTYQIGETVYQGHSYHTASATAQVVGWNNNILLLKNVSGHFVSQEPIYSINSNANYVFDSYNPAGTNNQMYVRLTSSVNPANANASSLYTTNTSIIEYP